MAILGQLPRSTEIYTKTEIESILHKALEKKLDKSGGTITGLVEILGGDDPALRLKNTESGNVLSLDALNSFTINPSSHIQTDFIFPGDNADDLSLIRHRDFMWLLKAYTSPMFDVATQYAIGDFCRHTLSRKTYGFRCTAPHIGNFRWSDFSIVLLPDEILALNSILSYSLNNSTPANLSVRKFTVNSATTTLDIMPTIIVGRVRDFFVETENTYSLSDIPTEASISFEGLGISWYSCVPKGETITDMMKLAPNELARFHFSETGFTKNNLPVFMITKQVVELDSL